MIVASRFVGPNGSVAGLPAVFWAGEGENPYHGLLGLADHFVVTADSVNMACEAAFTGKPVHIAEITGGTPKFRRFHRAMREAGVTRPFEGVLGRWSYEPLNETVSVAAEIRRRMPARCKAMAVPAA